MEVLNVLKFCAVLCTVNLMGTVAGNIIGGPGRLKGSTDDQRSPTIIDSRSGPGQFQAYWNIPTFQCRTKGVLFTDVFKKYGIIQNADDEFRGEKIAIMYDPGDFPALIEETRKRSYEFRNGGVPQEGDLDLHLMKFKEAVKQQIPDENFSGRAVIDFESWRPIFRQNFGRLQPYKEESYKLERRRHPLWPNSWVEKQAAKNFEQAGRKFVEQTILLAKEMRPLADWGYYAYPYCFNMNNQKSPECSNEVVQENNQIQWLWDSTDLLLPSVYLSSKRHNSRERIQMINGRINEAKRIQGRTKKDKSIFLYFWYKYQDDSNQFVTKEDVENSIQHMYNQGIEGVILWGSSDDVSSKEKCLKLREYVDNILGPVIKEFTNARVKSVDLQEDVKGNSTDSATVDVLIPEESSFIEIITGAEDKRPELVVARDNDENNSETDVEDGKESEMVEYVVQSKGKEPKIHQQPNNVKSDGVSIVEYIGVPENEEVDVVLTDDKESKGLKTKSRKLDDIEEVVSMPEDKEAEIVVIEEQPEFKQSEDNEFLEMSESEGPVEESVIVPQFRTYNNEGLFPILQREFSKVPIKDDKTQTNRNNVPVVNNETFDTDSNDVDVKPNDTFSKHFEAFLMKARFYSIFRP